MTTACTNKIQSNIKCGFYGCVVLIKDEDERIFAGKIALDKNSIRILRYEYSILHMLKDSEYIVNLKKTKGKIDELCDFIPDIHFKLDNGSELKTDKEYTMMVMEYIEGSNDLSDILKPTINFNDLDYKSIIIQIIKGVEFCHQNGVFCLDLNLSNILYYKKDGEIKIKLIDFGLVITNKEEKDRCIQQDYKSILKLFILFVIKKSKKEILWEDLSSLMTDFSGFIKKFNSDVMFSTKEKFFVNYMVDLSNTITIKDLDLFQEY